MWTFKTSDGTGHILHDGQQVGYGYSGHEKGLNNPVMESVRMTGPIPRGKWTIGPFFDDTGGKGPIVSHLIPQPGTITFQRSGFMIHGDNPLHNNSASEGCIILSRALRMMIRDSRDIELEVV